MLHLNMVLSSSYGPVCFCVCRYWAMLLMRPWIWHQSIIPRGDLLGLGQANTGASWRYQELRTCLFWYYGSQAPWCCTVNTGLTRGFWAHEVFFLIGWSETFTPARSPSVGLWQFLLLLLLGQRSRCPLYWWMLYSNCLSPGISSMLSRQCREIQQTFCQQHVWLSHLGAVGQHLQPLEGPGIMIPAVTLTPVRAVREDDEE